MKHLSCIIPLVLFPISCTMIDQKDAFLDQLTANKPFVVFSDNFENGLSQWNQASGSWTTSTPGMGGLALQRPSSATAITFNITTAKMIDLTGKTSCVLEYDSRYLFKGVSGVSANVLFGTTVIHTFKDTSGESDISSGSNFVRRKAVLPDNGMGRISFVSSVIDNTTGYADWFVDNVTVTCNSAASTAVTVLEESFDTSAANWSLQNLWAWNATGGVGGAPGLVTNGGGGNAYQGTSIATYVPSIDLSRRYGCQLQLFYNHANSVAQNCLTLDWNSIRIWTQCGSGTAGTLKLFLTPNDDTATNTMQFRCIDANGALGGNNTCTVDQLKLICQQ